MRESKCSFNRLPNCFSTCLESDKKNLPLRYKQGRRGGLVVSVLDTGSSGLGSGPGRGHCVVFLDKTLYSHGASLHPGVYGYRRNAGGDPAMD